MNALPPEERERLRARIENVRDMCLDAESGNWPHSAAVAEIRKVSDALLSDLPSILHTLEMVESLTEKLDDIREALPDDSPSHRADITGQTMAEDVADLVKANDGFQKLCGELRAELAASKEREQGLREELAYLKESMVRVAQEFGISTPLLLIAMAENNEETYTDILIKHIRKTLSTQPAQSPWRPIETAPKGKVILLGYSNELENWRTVVGRYFHPGTLQADPDNCDDEWAPEGWYEEADSYEYLNPTRCQPTHWMPLPQPPTKGEES